MAELVLAYGAPPLPLGSVDDLDEFGAYALYQGADPLNLGAHEGKHVLISARPFDPAAVVEIPLPLPLGDAGDGTLQAFTIRGDTSTIYPAATFGMSTRPDDVPADTYVPGRYPGDFNFSVSLFDGANPLTDGAGGAGVLKLIDPDGELEDLIDLGWDGAMISLRRGNRGDLVKTWSTIANLTAAGIVSSLREKEIDLRDLSWALKTAELHGQRYAGTSGLEGDSRLAGTIKPYAAGWCFNVTPAQISAAALCYQFTYTSAHAVLAVRDGGITLAAGPDYPTYEALIAATVPPATSATCLAKGLLRLGSTPEKAITADVAGDNDTIDGQAFPQTRGQIARRIATRLGTVRLSEASQFDFTALAALESQQPGEVGFYWSAEIDKASALNEIMRGCMGWWTVRIDGRFAVGQVEDPDAGAPFLVLSYPGGADPVESRLGEPELVERLPPRRATFVGYRKNYTPQDPAALNFGLTPTEIAAYGNIGLFASALDQWTANNNPTSPAITVEGNYRDEDDANAEAFRQQRIWSVARSRWRLPAVMDSFIDITGRKVRIDNLNKLGWGASKSFFSPGITANGDQQPTLNLWG